MTTIFVAAAIALAVIGIVCKAMAADASASVDVTTMTEEELMIESFYAAEGGDSNNKYRRELDRRAAARLAGE